MNLSAILVVASPSVFPDLIPALNALPGVEVHHLDAVTGRLIVMQEAPSVRAEVDGLKRIQALPGVALAELVYHYFAEDAELVQSLPPDLDEHEGLRLARVPAPLNEQ